MDQVAIDKKVEQAEELVHTYGALLARLKHVNTALPESLLPASRDQLRQAIQTLLWEVDGMDMAARNGLVQAYVYLEQFLPDKQVEILAKGQAALQSADLQHEYWDCITEANEIVTRIKVAMENAMQEMRIYLPHSK